MDLSGNSYPLSGRPLLKSFPLDGATLLDREQGFSELLERTALSVDQVIDTP